ncbi:beta strand repeat-containing protein [Alicyclobacillus fructus]|uniref:beta strand repeat-containing protein n=1 Tax=Alicyclobacillus fructus TaxID=2816082 RepID=UPI001A8D1CE7|nr:Immunoglobulin-like domain BIg-containing protein [Alicyclobacillus fructus]
MKRTLSGIASAAIVLGAISPMAFAATSTSGLTPAGQLPIVVNGQVLSNPYEMVGYDSGNKTGFFPIYYFSQALAKIGIQSTWNGATHTWALTDSNVNAANVQVAGGVGTGNTTVTLNGTAIKMFNTQAAKDPAGGPVTTYMPIYYVNNILTALGIKGTFSGQTGLNITTAQNTSGSSLSAISVTGATSGSGSVSSPAVVLNGGSVTLSTTLTDANGNPIPNTAVTFNVSNYGNYPGYLPTVKNASGVVVSGTKQTNAEQYTVYTDSNGVAKVTLSGPSGQTYAYQVVATAPYQGSSSSAVSTQPAYVEFVVNNQAGLAPYASDSSNPYRAAMGTPVPITVVLPPNSSGQPQANVAVTLTVTSGSTDNPCHAEFVNSSGQVLGQQIQVVTNSNGVAQAYLSDSYGEEVKVSVSDLPVGVNAPDATWISFAQAGIPAKIANLNVSSNNPSIGDQVTVSGQLQDAAGNPVPNGQILVTSPNVTASGDSGHLAYVNGSTTTTFPLISSVSAGAPATSAYGEVVTADSNGNFSFTLTDPRVETVQFFIYPVANGQVQSSTPLNNASADQNTLSFAQSTTLAYLSIGSFDSYVQANSDTSLSGLTAVANSGPPYTSQYVHDENIATVYVEPQNSAGHHAGGALNNTALTYTLSVDNGGVIYEINGTQLASPAGAVTLQYDGAGHFTANGQTIPALNTTGDICDFSVGVTNANPGTTTLTVQSGNVKSTATITFNAYAPAQVANFSPGIATVVGGQKQQISFQVQDVNGNPVPNAAATIDTDESPNDPFWITQVNGVALQESLNMGSSENPSYVTEPTPIPLGAVPKALNYDVSIPGVVSWQHTGNEIQVYTDSNGNVQLTVQAGGLSYPTQVDANHDTANPNNIVQVPTTSSTSSNMVEFFTNPNTSGNTVPLFVGVGNSPSGLPSGFIEIGALGWTGSGSGTGTTTPVSTGLYYHQSGSLNGKAAVASKAGYSIGFSTGTSAAASAAITVSVGNDDKQVNVFAGDNAASVAQLIAQAFANDSTYNVTTNGSEVIFTEKTPSGNPIPAVTVTDNYTAPTNVTATEVPADTSTGNVATAGAVTLTFSAPSGITSNGTLVVSVGSGSVSVPYTAGESVSTVVANLYAQLVGNQAITGSYSITTSGNTVTITQKNAGPTTDTVTVSGATSN